MRSIIFCSIMILSFCFISQDASAQEAVEMKDEVKTELDSTKNELVNKYSWVKTFFEKGKSPVHSISEMISGNGFEFVLIETEESKKFYDVELSHATAADKNLSNYYTPELLEKVYQKYHIDFEYFNYLKS